jgi:hypothetical protein
MIDVELSGQNSFLYSGGRPLQDGKTYVWRVVSKVRTAGGTDIDVSSPIGEFIVTSSPDGIAGDALLSQLQEILGPRYAPIFAQIKHGGFTLTGTYQLNGTTIQQNALLDLLNQLREVGDSIDVTFE